MSCPSCEYAMDVELLSVHLEETVFCPCCKVRIKLLDDHASVYGAEQKITSAIQDFRSMAKKLNQTFKISI